jgi:hypothetical protein
MPAAPCITSSRGSQATRAQKREMAVYPKHTLQFLPPLTSDWPSPGCSQTASMSSSDAAVAGRMPSMAEGCVSAERSVRQ